MQIEDSSDQMPTHYVCWSWAVITSLPGPVAAHGVRMKLAYVGHSHYFQSSSSYPFNYGCQLSNATIQEVVKQYKNDGYRQQNVRQRQKSRWLKIM